MIEYNENLYKKVIAKIGLEEQLGYFYEEVGELLQAINKYKRAKSRITKDNIIEEIVDVQITLDILKIGYKISEDNYKNIIDIKTRKLVNNCNFDFKKKDGTGTYENDNNLLDEKDIVDL